MPMNVDDILVIVILAVLLMYVYKGCGCKSGIDPTSGTKKNGNGNGKRKMNKSVEDETALETMSSVSNRVEGMAPLDFGTFHNNYPRGECQTGKFWERKPCEVGNCPLGTTVSDQQFCRIQCAQDPDAEERQECYEFCMKHTC
jgi:hypothetical protein